MSLRPLTLRFKAILIGLVLACGAVIAVWAQTTGQPGAISGVIGVSQQRGLIPALAIEVVDASGNQVTSFGGSGITAVDNGTIAGGQTVGLAAVLKYLWNGANWIREPLGLLDSGGGDATDAVNHAIKVTLPIGANVTATISGTPAVQGNKTNNNAAPSTNNLGVFPCVANAAAPTWTEGFLVGCSADLSGNTRVTVTNGSAVDANTYALAATAATATTTAGTLTCYVKTDGGTTSSTNCKNAPGNIEGIYIINTTATNYFLRLYNASAAPTCSSATGYVESIPALGATSNGGGISRMQMPQAFTTGIGFCITGGDASTSNTNAANGVFVTVLYK